MFNSVAEFKLLVVVLLVLFVAGLTMTRSGDKRRPQFLFALFLIYFSFQLFHLMEFFPVTAFQRYSQAEERVAKYYKMIPVLDGGTAIEGNPADAMPVFRQGRMDYFLRRVFQSQKDADLLASDYEKTYEHKIRRPEDPDFLGIRYEKRKWDWRRDPYDPEKGFVVKKITGEAESPKGNSNVRA